MRKVEAPTIAPHRCIFCTSGHRGGPVIDAEMEYPFGRLYVCLLHAELIAVTGGFAEGEECERLKGASEALAEAEKGLAEERKIREGLAAKLEQEIQDSNDLADELAAAKIRAAQAEVKLAELGQDIGATLAAVSSGTTVVPLDAVGIASDAETGKTTNYIDHSTGDPALRMPVETPVENPEPGMLYHADGTPYMQVGDYFDSGTEDDDES